MVEKFNFTDQKLEAIKLPTKGADVYRDAKEKGLILTASYGGTKTFYLYKKVKNNPLRIKIGQYPYCSINEAREAVVKLKFQLLKGEYSIPEEKRGLTFKDLFDKYVKDYAERNLSKKSLSDFRSRIKNDTSGIFDKTIKTINKQDILQIFHTASRRSAIGANRTVQYLSAVFSKGIEWELIDKNPAHGIKKNKEISRDRYITLDEKEQFLKALDAEPDSLIRDFVYIALYTGARKGNVLAMKWEDISLDQGVWHIPDTKNGDPQNAVLCEDAVKILERRAASTKSKWVFPCRGSMSSKSGHLQEPRKGWERICKRAGIEDLRIHDLRRTCGSWMALNGASQYIIGKMLGHKSPQSTAIYARLSLDPVREHLEAAMKLRNGDLQKKIEELKRKQEQGEEY